MGESVDRGQMCGINRKTLVGEGEELGKLLSPLWGIKYSPESSLVEKKVYKFIRLSFSRVYPSSTWHPLIPAPLVLTNNCLKRTPGFITLIYNHNQILLADYYNQIVVLEPAL